MEIKTAKDLINKFDDALDIIPHLVFEIGYTRPTGYMVHLWNSTGVGIKDAEKVFSIHDGEGGDFTESYCAIDNYISQNSQ